MATARSGLEGWSPCSNCSVFHTSKAKGQSPLPKALPRHSSPIMLILPEKALFIVLAVVSLYYTYRGFRQIIEIIRKGQPEYYSRFNQPLERIREALARTISQVTVFKNRPLVGFFHS
jgi:hypothetical protein